MQNDRLAKFALASIIIIVAAFLAHEAELRLAVPLLVGVTATMTLALATVLFLGRRNKVLWSPSVILAVALALRLMFLFTPPQLSDDVYRYLWDGTNLLRGINPYAAAPSAEKPPPELTVIHSRINHPDHVTIYPPAAQLLFAGGAALGGSVTALKGFLVLVDMGLCALMMVLLKRLEMPVWRAVLYAWNPLPMLEIASSGHVDGTGLTMLMGAFCLLSIERKNAAATVLSRWHFLICGALLATAGLVKLFPLVLAPVLFLLIPARQRFTVLAGFLGATTILVVPFLPHLGNMLDTLDTYARNWEFAGFAFNTLRTLTSSGTTARMLLSVFFLLAVTGIYFQLAGSIHSSESTASRMRQALDSCYAIALTSLLLTPTLQPWYALSLAVFLPFCAGPAGLVLCWTVFLTYQVQIPYFILGQWIENQQVTAVVFLAPVSAYLLGRVMKGRNTDWNSFSRKISW